jgi:hypothetical protein
MILPFVRAQYNVFKFVFPDHTFPLHALSMSFDLFLFPISKAYFPETRMVLVQILKQPRKVARPSRSPPPKISLQLIQT